MGANTRMGSAQQAVAQAAYGDDVTRFVGLVFDRKRGTLDLLGAWGDTGRLDEALDDLADFLGATRVVPAR